MINPVEELKKQGKYVTSPFGWRKGGASGNTTYKEGMHRGTDFGGYKCGEIFYSPLSGVVSAVKTSGMGTWGNTVCLSLDPDGSHTMLTAHHQKVLVKEGQRIERWDPIATVGGTTHVGKTYDCHVHLEIQLTSSDKPWRGDPTDPAAFWTDSKPEEPSDRFAAGNIIFNNRSVRINIRERPGTMYEVVGQVKPGEDVQVQEHGDNGIRASGYHWWYIDAGWIAEDFFDLLLFPDPEPVPPPEEEDPEESYPIEEEEDQKEQPEPPAEDNNIELVALMKLLIKKLSLFLELLGIERRDEK